MAEVKVLAGYVARERGARAAAGAGAAVVVVDTFRASTMIAVLVRKGAEVVSVASIEEAALYHRADYRIGERDSERVSGFDFGNSPREIEASGITPGSTVVPSTTNGTRVLEAAHGALAILAGAFVNAGAVADELATGVLGERVAVVGCGCKGRRASEDESAAGAILHHLRERGPTSLDGRAERVVDLCLSRPKSVLPNNSAARRLMRLGYKEASTFASPRTPCRSSHVSWTASSPAACSGQLAARPKGWYARGQAFTKNFLDRGVARLYSEVGQGGANVTSVARPPRKGGADI